MKTQKRIKQVFRNETDVCELFAKQSQNYAVFKTRARSDNSELTPVYFEGVNLYSYGSHYLLSRVGLALNGVPVSVVNFSRYSSSTTGHSYCAFRALEAQGKVVLEVREREDGRSIIREGIGDLELLALAVEELERHAASLAESFFCMTFRPYNTWYISGLLKDAKKHNELVAKLGLKCFVETPDRETLKSARQLYNLHAKAERNHSSREQFRLFSNERGYQTYRESAAIHRRTA